MLETSFLDLIDAFTGLRVLVIGEAMLDSYLAGVTERLCREAPVPVVSVQAREDVPGGAANTAVNIHSLGGDVLFLSVTGDDAEGQKLRRLLSSRGLSVENILIQPDRLTLAKQRILAGSQMVVRFDQGSTEPLSESVEQALIERLEQLYPTCQAVIVSDYGYGILSRGVIAALERLQAESPRVLLVDSKRLPAYHKVGVTAVKPNYEEAVRLLGLEKTTREAERLEQVEREGSRILDMANAQVAAITLDQQGSLVFDRDRAQPYRTYARAAPSSRAAGAGDTFVSAMALSLAAGAATENAAEIASAAASIVVGKDGTSACYRDELRGSFTTGEKFITDAFQLAARMAAYRREDKRIVFTNGCFDILHRGHITYLNKAKSFGDILIIGLNSDLSVRRLKGPTRPINTLPDRAQILAAMSCVDHIVAFDGDTPRDLIRVIRPDVYVKGGDYTRENLPEAPLVEELGGMVEILPYLQDHSTTSIIERIRQIYAANPAENRGGD